VARFVRLAQDVAEPAVSVVDEWQGRGVGSLLLDEIAHRARQEGIRYFAAPVLAQNETAIALLSRLGDTTVTNNGTEVELLVSLGEDDGSPPSLHRLLRHAAEQTILPSVAFCTGWRRGPGRRTRRAQARSWLRRRHPGAPRRHWPRRPNSR